MKIAITGASGFIGSALVPALRSQGHDVVRLVRREAASSDEISWDPEAGTFDREALTGTEAFVHLAGVGIGEKRWTNSFKRSILESRTRGTDTIARAAASLDPLPSVLVSASAIGYYGDTGDTKVDEDSPQGDDFFADVVAQWEAAAAPAKEAGIRVVHPRSGIVAAPKGGAWARMLPLFRLGLGGRLGSGRQWWSFVSIADELAALSYLLSSDLSGPVNITAPNPATNAEITHAMGQALGRPTFLPVPEFALRVALGGLADTVLTSCRVIPTKLNESGFEFANPTISSTLKSIL